MFVNAHQRCRIAVACAVGVVSWLVPIIASSASKSAKHDNVTFRPVLCFAPLHPAAPKATIFPKCAAPYRLTPANLGVAPGGMPSDFEAKTVPPDPDFQNIPTSSAFTASTKTDVVLSGIAGGGFKDRFVLGPARMTGSSIEWARAQKQSGRWVVLFQLTVSGNNTWNAFLKSQFHEMFAVVANDQVYSTAIAYWDSSHFFIFYGVNNTGYLTKPQADELAKEMNASAS
jgi:hypothetical protein